MSSTSGSAGGHKDMLRLDCGPPDTKGLTLTLNLGGCGLRKSASKGCDQPPHHQPFHSDPVTLIKFGQVCRRLVQSQTPPSQTAHPPPVTKLHTKLGLFISNVHICDGPPPLQLLQADWCERTAAHGQPGPQLHATSLRVTSIHPQATQVPVMCPAHYHTPFLPI